MAGVIRRFLFLKPRIGKPRPCFRHENEFPAEEHAQRSADSATAAGEPVRATLLRRHYGVENFRVKGGDDSYSHVIYSDDHGKSWQIGGTVADDKTNECQVVELDDGTLLLNMRSHHGRNRRAVATSRDAEWTAALRA